MSDGLLERVFNKVAGTGIADWQYIRSKFVVGYRWDVGAVAVSVQKSRSHSGDYAIVAFWVTNADGFREHGAKALVEKVLSAVYPILNDAEKLRVYAECQGQYRLVNSMATVVESIMRGLKYQAGLSRLLQFSEV